MIIIDNYDSFTYNIVEYFKILGINPCVYKNDEVTINELKKKNFSFLVLSPGPNSPNESGITIDCIDYFKDKKYILGVCLGFQAIAQYFGCAVLKAKEPVHGETSKIYFKEDEKLFKGFKQGFEATRYHSLTVKENGKIAKTAWLEDGTIMGLRVDNNIFGVQFHPEAILTQNGIEIFKNFINKKTLQYCEN